MRRTVLSALLLGGALLLLQAAPVLADKPGAGITVEPAEVTAGQTILLAGNSLEPNEERVIVLQGEGITVNLGTAPTDADGMLSQEIQIPGHLPSGSYQLQAIGDETLQVELKVTAAEGGAATQPEPDGGAIANRQRSAIELSLIAIAAVFVGGLGALLVVRAERFRGGAPV